jgi:DUF1680 family protein
MERYIEGGLAMHPIPCRDVEITGGFWRQLQARNREVTVPAIRARFMETGRFAALDVATPWAEGKKPHIFWDSDVAKWLEAAAYLLLQAPDAQLEQAVEEAISLLEKQQWDDGYCNSYYTAVEPNKRWSDRNCHELYCAGHLIEAAVAWYEATGRDRFLRCVEKYAAHIERVFMTEDSAAFRTPGHEEIELALVKLYRCAGEARWLRLSQFFVEQRGANDKEPPQIYCQGHRPVREQTTAEGHAVRAVYLYCAMADLAAELSDDSLTEACETLFENITQRRMYVTGGIGSTHQGEAFTIDYDLPNETAYSETCAAIGLALFARRMSALQPDGRYADDAERAVYNGVLAGVSEDGASFFYELPLEIHPALRHRHSSTSGGEHYPLTQRQKMFGCSCCPPNIARFIASFGEFLFTQSDDTLYIHHYASARTEQIELVTEYPREGEIALRLRGMAGKRVALHIPGWCEKFQCSVAGVPEAGYYYADVPDDDFSLRLTLEMPVRLVFANANVCENIGRVAVARGPVVYCMEAVDNGANLRALSLAPDAVFTGGFDCFECDGLRLQDMSALYSSESPQYVPQRLKFIPYHRFANRGESADCGKFADCGEGEMAVWIRVAALP